MSLDVSQVDITLDDMEYTADYDHAHAEHGGYNEYYKGILPNGDILYLSRYGYYANRDYWEWAVYIPEDFPIQCYQRGCRGHEQPSAEEALDDFYESYGGRNWKSLAEQEAKGGKTYYRCLECGWEGESSEIGARTVYEDYGDVVCLVCPACGRTQYDGMELLVELGN